MNLQVLVHPFDWLLTYRRLQFWLSGLKRKTVVLRDGQSISYWDGGKGDTVVLVHGLGGSIFQDFGAAASALSKKHRVICFDLPGFGLSHPFKFEQSISNQADFLLAMFDALKIPRAHLVGNSMGGWVSLKFTHQHPERVQKLILTAAAGIRFEPPPFEVFTPTTEDEVEHFFKHLKSNPPKLPRFVLKDWLRHALERQESVRTMLRSMASGDDLMDDHLSEIKASTLILWGDKDRMIPVSTAHQMAAGIPGAKLQLFPGCGHLLFHEDFCGMMKAIEDWLRHD